MGWGGEEGDGEGMLGMGRGWGDGEGMKRWDGWKGVMLVIWLFKGDNIDYTLPRKLSLLQQSYCCTCQGFVHYKTFGASRDQRDSPKIHQPVYYALIHLRSFITADCQSNSPISNNHIIWLLCWLRRAPGSRYTAITAVNCCTTDPYYPDNIAGYIECIIMYTSRGHM